MSMVNLDRSGRPTPDHFSLIVLPARSEISRLKARLLARSNRVSQEAESPDPPMLVTPCECACLVLELTRVSIPPITFPLTELQRTHTTFAPLVSAHTQPQ